MVINRFYDKTPYFMTKLLFVDKTMTNGEDLSLQMMGFNINFIVINPSKGISL